MQVGKVVSKMFISSSGVYILRHSAQVPVVFLMNQT